MTQATQRTARTTFTAAGARLPRLTDELAGDNYVLSELGEPIPEESGTGYILAE
jgi:hypothetical protein